MAAQWGGRAARQATETAAVLWQTALWQVAAERDPATTAAELRTWWAAPTLVDRSERVSKAPVPITVPIGTDYEAAWTNLSALAGLRSWDKQRRPPRLQLTDGPIEQISAASASLVGCPWLFRNQQKWHANAVRTAYPEWNDPPSLIRLSAAATLAVDLLDAVPPGPDENAEHLLALLVMPRDLAVTSPLRAAIDTEAEATGPMPAAALVSLYNHALRVTDRCGKGHGPHAVPRRIVGMLTDGAAGPRGVRLRAHPVEPIDAPGGADDRVLVAPGDRQRWLGGGRGRRPRLVLRRRADPGRPAAAAPARRTARPAGRVRTAPALLERDLRPADDADGWDWRPHEEPQWDWLPEAHTYGPAGDGRDDAERSQFISANVLLLAPRHGLPTWREWSGRLAKALGREPAPQALQAVRLEALLGSPDNARSHDDWVTEWAQNLTRRVVPRELARVVRRRMVDLLDAPVAGAESELRVARVGELVIDTILDLSRGAQWYYQLLLDALSRTTAPEGLATQWRHRAVATLYRLGEAPPDRAAISPYESVGRRTSAVLTGDALRGLLHRHSAARIVGQEATLGDAVELLWRELRTGPPVTRDEATLGELDEAGARRVAVHDLLTTLLVQVDRYQGTVVTYRDGQAGRSGRRRGSTVGRSVAPRGDWSTLVARMLDRAGESYGVVCAVDPAARRAWVNAGLGQPAECVLSATDPLPAVGDLVVTTFAGTPARPRVDGPLRPVVRPLDTGDVRAATVEAAKEPPWLSVRIDGVDVYPGLDVTDENASATRWRWDPDLSRRHDGTHTGTVETCARWDDAVGHWVPVDRGGRELIAGEHGDLTGGLRLVFAGQVTDDEDTRLRFVTRPGRAYLLDRDDFAPADWSTLLELVGDGTPGLVVVVQAGGPAGRLTLTDEVDDRNRTWLQIFDERDDGDTGVHVAHRTEQGWRLPVAAPPEGFPVEIAVDGLQVAAANALCLVREWGEPQARAAAVAAEQLEDRGVARPQDASIARWDALIHLSPGTRTRLRAIAGGNLRRDSLLGFTEDGLRMQLPTESVALAADPASISRFGRQRDVVVESDRLVEPTSTHAAVPVPTEQLLGLSGSAGLADVLAAADDLDGLVVQQVRDSGQHTVQYDVWLRHGTWIGHAVVPGGRDVGGGGGRRPRRAPPHRRGLGGPRPSAPDPRPGAVGPGGTGRPGLARGGRGRTARPPVHGPAGAEPSGAGRGRRRPGRAGAAHGHPARHPVLDLQRPQLRAGAGRAGQPDLRRRGDRVPVTLADAGPQHHAAPAGAARRPADRPADVRARGGDAAVAAAGHFRDRRPRPLGTGAARRRSPHGRSA